MRLSLPGRGKSWEGLFGTVGSEHLFVLWTHLPRTRASVGETQQALRCLLSAYACSIQGGATGDAARLGSRALREGRGRMDVFRPSHGKTGRWCCRAIHESPLRSRRIGVLFVGADIIRPAAGRTVINGRILSAPTANCFTRCTFSVGRGILDAPPPTSISHPGGVNCNGLPKGYALISGSGARGTTGRLERAAGR